MLRRIKWIAMLIAQGFIAFAYAQNNFINFLPPLDFLNKIPAEVQPFINLNLVVTAAALVIASIIFDIVLFQKKRLFGYIWQLVMLIIIGTLVYAGFVYFR